MAEFYEHPETGKLHFRGTAGGGNSTYDGVATESDMRNYPEAHAHHVASKERAKADVDAMAADEVDIDEAAAKMAAAIDQLVVPHPDQPTDAETKASEPAVPPE